MGDFYQNGIVTTLHNLAGRPVEAMEAELLEFSRQRPMGLLLPSLYSMSQARSGRISRKRPAFWFTPG